MKVALTTALAYTLSFGSIPLIARLYDPTQIGVFSLFGTIMMIIIPLMSLCNEMGVSNELDKNKGIQYCELALKSTLVHGLLITGILVGLKYYSEILNDLEFWIVISISISAGLGIFHSVGLALAVRDRKDDLVSNSIFINQTSRPFLQILLGIFSGSVSSLVLSELLGRLLSYLTIRKTLNEQTNISSVFKNNNSYFDTEYAKWSLSKVLVDNLILWALPFLITIQYGAHAGGITALTQRIGMAAISYFNIVLGTFFHRKLVLQGFENNLAIKKYINIWMIKLILVGAFIIASIYFIGEIVVSFLFGILWKDVANIALILVPMYTIQICYVLIDRLLISLKQLKKLLAINIYILLGMVLSVITANAIELSYSKAVLLISTVTSLGYILSIIYVYMTILRESDKVSYHA